MLKIAFLSNKLTLRGTEVNLYDYADFNETILGNKSIIITRDYESVKYEQDVSILAYEKFKNRFTVLSYVNNTDIENIVNQEKIDTIFIEKSGEYDGICPSNCKVIIHCVFNTTQKHGTYYTCISDFVNTLNNTNIPVLPNIVRTYDTDEDLKQILNIPWGAKVFGTYSGENQFDIDYMKQAILGIDNMYFIFMNVLPFCIKPNVIFLKGTADMKTKRKFINTCDAMIYGRCQGETFGISIGEFSICGKPIILCNRAEHRYHLDLLSSNCVLHSCKEEFIEILQNFKPRPCTEPTGYNQFTPKNVMDIFSKYIL
jgi:glycosyltransferase involved in cell wall biosynthesis